MYYISIPIPTRSDHRGDSYIPMGGWWGGGGREAENILQHNIHNITYIMYNNLI